MKSVLEGEPGGRRGLAGEEFPLGLLVCAGIPVVAVFDVLCVSVCRARGPRVWSQVDPEKEEDGRPEQPREGQAQAAAVCGAVGPGASSRGRRHGGGAAKASNARLQQCPSHRQPSSASACLALPLQVRKRLAKNKSKSAKNYKGHVKQ